MPAPVVLFVYNRPDHTRQTVEALAKNELARETELWIYSDAPQTPEAAESVAGVRRYIHSLAAFSWFSSVLICEAVQNKGLAKSIITGVTEVIEARGCAIVLEDDLVTAPDFLLFMNECLRFYKDNPRVGSISGYSPVKHLPEDYIRDVYFVSRSCSTGWATWLDRWQQVDWEVHDFEVFKKDRGARKAFDQCGSDRYDRLRRQVVNNLNSWSVRFGYWQFRQGMNTVYSSKTRVRNIGNDGSGVHNAAGATYNDDLSETPISFTLSNLESDVRIIQKFHKVFSGSYLSQMWRLLRNSGFMSFYFSIKKMFFHN